MPLHHFLIGADFGKTRDPSAIAVLRHDVAADHLLLRHLEIFPQGTAFRVVVQRIAALVRKVRPTPPGNRAWRELHGRAWPEDPPVTIAVDATGLGQPVTEMLREEPWEAGLVPIVFTGPGHAHFDPATGHWNVPKIDLVQDVIRRVQDTPPRYFCPTDLALAAELEKQFGELQEKISATGRLSYQHEAEGDRGGHGDLAVAACVASWAASRVAAGQTQIGWL